MIVVAIDNSSSITWQLDKYKTAISKVLFSLKPPIQVIIWNSCIDSNKVYEFINLESILNFDSYGCTEPSEFIKILPLDKDIELYIFTDAQIDSDDVKKCRKILKKRNILLAKVHLHYIGIEERMNLQFTELFDGIIQKIHINDDYIGCIDTQSLKFDDIDYDFIMKDDTFKLTILNLISKVDNVELKNKLHKLESRILKDYFKNKLGIASFYVNQDVEGCVSYVKSHSFYNEKSQFQKKMADILKLFDKDVDRFSLRHFKKAEKYSLDSTKEIPSELIECEYLNCDILYEKCQIACIPIKKCEDNIWIENKILSNPFKILESNELIQRITNVVEPYIMDYKNTYTKLLNPDTSPFTRDALKGVYILYNEKISVDALTKHNNYVLSTLFQNRLPGKSVIWHMVFLYILATKRFPDIKELLFKEIRFLGEQAQYFITLTPFLNPSIVENLNCCFWYIAQICFKAFPNSKKNLLRTSEFISGEFLKFYQNVYDKNYVFPKEMPRWQLWYTLCRDKRAIFKILSHYYQHEKLPEIILYNKVKRSNPSADLNFLCYLRAEEILNVYKKFLESHNFYEDLKEIKETEIISNDPETKSLLSHVVINPITCHPYVICKITGKHWKECIGEYNVRNDSYLRLFKRYCAAFKKYPESCEDLMRFLNEYIFNHNGPHLFRLSLRERMNQVMTIYEDVRKKYTCKEYLKLSNLYFSEKKRLMYDNICDCILVKKTINV